MRAVVAHEYGTPDVLKLEQVQRPEPNDDEALVRVIASSVNPADPLTLSGKYAKEFGTHLAADCGVRHRWHRGKNGREHHQAQNRRRDLRLSNFRRRLGGLCRSQRMGSRCKTQISSLCGNRGGSNGCFDRLAGISGCGETPARANNPHPRRLWWRWEFCGADRQSARCPGHCDRLDKNQDLLKQLGADVAVDYTKTKFEDVAKDVDAVLDPVGKETLARSYGVVKKGGIVMSLVARPDPAELQKHGIRGAGISAHPDADDLTEIAQLVDAGKIKPIVTEVLSLTDAVKAQQQAATHHTRGKVVLRIADEPKG